MTLGQSTQDLDVSSSAREGTSASSQRADAPSLMAEESNVNVGSTERALSTAAGLTLMALGLSRKSLPGVLIAGAGGLIAWRGVSGHCPAYAALDIDTTDRDTDGAPPEAYFRRGLHFQSSFTIANKTRHELYAYWRDLENLPRIFQHLERVQKIDERRSHWTASGPFAQTFEWDAEIINDEPDGLIAWRSLAGAEVDNAGSVRFVDAPGNRGTELKVTLDYIPPAGVVGKTLAMLLGQNPEHQMREDIRRFKRVMECGEAPTTEGQPRGTCGG
jgi:uncharacterized membrane protein